MDEEKITSLGLVFCKGILGITIKLALIWFSLCFVYYGIMFELPTILLKIEE